MKKKDSPKRYLKIVEWSDEDRCYVGTCPGLMFGGVHGEDEAKVYAELCEAVEEVVALKEKHGDPLPPEFEGREFSGKFVLRVPATLHKLLAIRAMQAGESLNAYAVKKLTETA